MRRLPVVAELRGRRDVPAMTAKSTPAPRPCKTWDPDPELGTDWRGRQTCRTCQRLGAPDDPAHTPPSPQPVRKTRISPALAAAAAAREAAILGERDPDEESL